MYQRHDNIQIKIKIPNPSQGPPGSSKSPNKDLKDKDVLCTFTIKIERPNSKHVCIKDCWPYCYQDQHAKPQSRSSSILQSPKWELKGHGCFLHLQNQSRETKVATWVYQTQVTILKSTSGTHSPVRNLQCPPNPKWGLKGNGCLLHLQNWDREPKFGI